MYLFFIILLVLCVVYVLKIRCSRLYRMMFKLPAGSLELPLVGSGFNFLGSPEGTMKRIIQASNNVSKLGGAARFYTFNIFVIGLTDALDVAEALKTYLDKDYLYSFLQAAFGNGSAFAPASIAKIRRQVVMPSFSTRMLNSFVDDFWKESVKLTEALAPHAGAGPFSLENYLQAFSFDTILSTGIGVKDSDQEFCRKDLFNAINKSMTLVNERLTRIWMHPNFIYRFTSNNVELQRNVKILYHYADKVIKYRRDEIKDYKHRASTDSNKAEGVRNYIFDALIESDLSDEESKEEIVLLVGATDLAGISMGFTLMLLGLYPEVQDKVYKELQDVFLDSDRALVKDDYIKLRYLDMVIKESLRLYPPAPLLARKALKETTLPSGRIVPSGAGVLAFVLGLHRNPKYWGPDAEHFDPERFMPERFEKIHPNAYIPFSYGARNCVGYKYGLMAMKTAISSILRKYKIVGEPAQGPIPGIRTKFGIFMKAVNNFEIELVSRN